MLLATSGEHAILCCLSISERPLLFTKDPCLLERWHYCSLRVRTRNNTATLVVCCQILNFFAGELLKLPDKFGMYCAFAGCDPLQWNCTHCRGNTFASPQQFQWTHISQSSHFWIHNFQHQIFFSSELTDVVLNWFSGNSC